MANLTLTKPGPWTDQELRELPADGRKRELLNGKPDLRLGDEVLPGFRCRLAQLFPQAR